MGRLDQSRAPKTIFHRQVSFHADPVPIFSPAQASFRSRLTVRPETLRYADDTLPLVRSTLYAVYASGDTAILNVDSAYWNGWSDGGGEILGAYTFSPRFADLDGDGRLELFVETRKGTIFFNRDKAGAFVRAEGRWPADIFRGLQEPAPQAPPCRDSRIQ